MAEHVDWQPAAPGETTSVWDAAPPADCPLPRSSDFTGLRFTGRFANYTQADTWYPTWAADGTLYSPFTDGTVDTWSVASVGIMATTGQAKITGDDPLDLQVIPIGSSFGSPGPYTGRYPCGSLVKDGIWYYGTYCLDDGGRGLNWDVLGPFVGFRTSRDLGLTWQNCPHTPESPLFGESALRNAKVKIGAPKFVDFGRELEHSPDGKAYLLGHGGSDPHGDVSWISGDEIYAARVDVSPETMNDPAAYEFFDGTGWTRDFASIQPLVNWPGHTGCVTATYNPVLKKFLMCVTDGWPTTATMDSYLLEADRIEGPWKVVTYMPEFGNQAYFLNLPSKFIQPNGRTLWLCYSANFTEYARTVHAVDYVAEQAPIYANPPGSSYSLVLQEVELLSAGN